MRPRPPTVSPSGRHARDPRALLSLILYLVALTVGPILHHDLACHQRTPAHCPACLAHPPAPPVDGAAADAVRLPAAGHLLDGNTRQSPALVRAPSPGRSPPPA